MVYFLVNQYYSQIICLNSLSAAARFVYLPEHSSRAVTPGGGSDEFSIAAPTGILGDIPGGGGLTRPLYNSSCGKGRSSLDAEANAEDIPVLDNVFLTLEAY
jgi:hypothetical protein